MFDADITELLGLSKDEICCELASSPERFRLRVNAQLYEASTRSQLADEWLAAWYLGERLAALCQSASVYFRRTDKFGNGSVTFTFHYVDPAAMAEALEEMATGYDEEDLEGMAFHLQAAYAWLETRADTPAKLPDLEEAFRGEEQEAQEHEGYGADESSDDDNDDNGVGDEG